MTDLLELLDKLYDPTYIQSNQRLPNKKTLINGYKLSYSIPEYSLLNNNAQYLYITIETTNLSKNLTIYLSFSYHNNTDIQSRVQNKAYPKPSINKQSITWPISYTYIDFLNQLHAIRDQYFMDMRLKTIEILKTSYKDLPTLINNPEPFGELAIWILQLPK